MRVHMTSWWFPCILLLVAALAGCITGDTDDGPKETNERQENPPDPLLDSDDGETDPVEDEAELPCHERSRARAMPHEQQVENESDIRCPGHYWIKTNGTGATTEDPGWSIGDWWLWKVEHNVAGCFQARWEVTGETSKHNIGLWQVQVQPRDCLGAPQDDPRTWLYTKEHLVRMFEGSRDGFIPQEYHFPLADGKQWVYMDWGPDNIIEASVDHIDEYSLGDDVLEVWRVERKGENQQGESWTQRSWFSPDAGNMVHQTFHKGAVSQETWTLIDSSSGYGDTDLLPGLPHPIPLP